MYTMLVKQVNLEEFLVLLGGFSNLILLNKIELLEKFQGTTFQEFLSTGTNKMIFCGC